MDKDSSQQPEPIYPQQYPPEPYPPPYYYPYPPPEKDDKKVMIVIILVIVIVFILPTIMAAILYWTVINWTPDHPMIPTGTWGQKTILSPTSVEVDFGKIHPEPAPMELTIVLTRNLTDQGHYVFDDNQDGELSIVMGVPVGTLTYKDMTDNRRVNAGDSLLLTDLQPSSDYRLRMLWSPTGDQITSTTFFTP